MRLFSSSSRTFGTRETGHLSDRDAVTTFLKVKSKIEKKVDNFIYSGVEWRPYNYLNLNKEQNEKVIEVLEALDEDDDVQSTFINCNVEMI